MRRWYLIQTKPLGESIAQSNLERQGYEVYFPRLVRLTLRRGRRGDQIAALFPRYLFLHLDEGRQSLAPVRSTIGVANVVRFGFSHAIVPDHVIHDLRARADAVTGLHRLSSEPVLACGMTVRITRGPFDGLEGVFEREVGTERVVVLLKLLGQDTRVRISSEFVARSGAVA